MAGILTLSLLMGCGQDVTSDLTSTTTEDATVEGENLSGWAKPNDFIYYKNSSYDRVRFGGFVEDDRISLLVLYNEEYDTLFYKVKPGDKLKIDMAGIVIQINELEPEKNSIKVNVIQIDE